MKVRVHMPAAAESAPLPLIVALHGCRQSAADFAAGTQLDAIADREGFVVAYPEQDESVNRDRCWNWFWPENQTREGPEPAAVLRIVDALVASGKIDRERIFVVGLSAGAALAAVLAEQAPDIFAGVAMFAGVALHSAHDVDSAYLAMSGHREPDAEALAALLGKERSGSERLRAMIFTGTDDRRVDPSNAGRLAAQFALLVGIPDDTPYHFEPLADGARITWSDGTGRIRVALRTVAGLAHAWSGGSFRGSFTDPMRSDASEEIVRFFLDR